MIQKIFKKFKDNFSNKFNLNKENYSRRNSFVKSSEISGNKSKILNIDGNQFDISSIDKESQNTIELYEISNIKIQFFENLLKQLKINRNLQIMELKSKLKKENSLT